MYSVVSVVNDFMCLQVAKRVDLKKFLFQETNVQVSGMNVN